MARQHADDGIGGLIQRNGLANHVGVSPVMPFPPAMRDHRHGSRTRLIIFRSDGPSHKWPDAVAGKVIARNEHRDRGGCLSTRHRSDSLRSECEYRGKPRAPVAELTIERVRERSADFQAAGPIAGARAGVAALESRLVTCPVDEPQVAGGVHGQRAQEHGVQHGKDRRVGANAEGERQQCYRSEAGRFEQLPDRKTNVPPDAIAEACAAPCAALFTNALEIAKSLARLPRGRLRRHAGSDSLRRGLLKVEAQFLVNLPLHRPPRTEGANSQPDTHRCFHASRFGEVRLPLLSVFWPCDSAAQAVCNTSVIARQTRSQMAVSSSNCLRPARVSE